MKAIHWAALFVALIVRDSIAQPNALDLFNSASPSLAIITAGNATGSGFICEVAGKKRLVTNEHVLRSGRPISASLINGQKLKLGTTLQLGNDSDLAIIDLVGTNDFQALELSRRQPLAGESIFVFGNSDGGGVATVIDGAIRGIGPDRIEVDAPFVQGNSGSPILLSDGSVIAVASYAQRSIDPEDWVKTGTRFEDVRRFGLRLENVEWVAMTPKDYFRRVNVLIDFELYCKELVWYSNLSPIQRYDYAKHSYKYKENFGYCTLIDKFSQRMVALNNLHNQKVDFIVREENRRKRSRGETPWSVVQEFLEMKEQTEVEGRKYARAAGNLVNMPATWLENYDWGTDRFKEEGEKLIALLGFMGLHYGWIKGFESPP